MSEKRDPDQNWLEIETNVCGKFVVKVHCATMKYEIIRKPMVLETVEVDSLKFGHC